MHYQAEDKRNAPEYDSNEHERPAKKPRVDPTPALTAANLFSRPLSEPPILCHDELIERVKEELKQQKEKPELHHPDIKVRMDYLDDYTEQFLLQTYLDWALDMGHEASQNENH